jgi:hypothetical protein
MLKILTISLDNFLYYDILLFSNELTFRRNFMAKSNAERQAEFRTRMKARGFREKLIWVDWEGHRGSARAPELPEQKPALTLAQLTGRLRKITAGMDGYDTSRLFAELAAHARGLREKWNYNETLLEPEHRSVTK